MTTKAHNPTPEERDERFSLYGMAPEEVVRNVLEVKPEEEPKPTPRPRATRRTRSEGK